MTSANATKVLIAIVSLFFGTLCNDVSAVTVDVTTFGANGFDLIDDAPAFQAAYAACVQGGGGTVFVPAGKYFFDNKDPLDNTTSVLIRHRGVRFAGEARGGGGTIPGDTPGEFGSVIIGRSSLHLFKIIPYRAGVDPVVQPQAVQPLDPGGNAFENLYLTRNGVTDEALTNSQSAGIVFDNGYPDLPNSTPDIFRFVFSNLRIDRQYDAIRTEHRSLNNYVRPRNVWMQQCELSHNIRDGFLLQDFNEVRIDHCMFFGNGRNGMRVTAYRRYFGTIHITGCGVAGNQDSGLVFLGFDDTTTPVGEQYNRVQDIMLVGCQVDANRKNGIRIQRSSNVQIVGCLVSANGSDSSGPDFDRSGIYLDNVQTLSMSGDTLLSNGGAGIWIANCLGGSISGCTLTYNNNNVNPLPQHFALVVDGGEDISLSGLSFAGGAPQSYGIQLRGNIQRLFATANTFGAGVTTPIQTSLVSASARYRVERLDATGYHVASQP